VHPVTGRQAIGWRKARRGEFGDQPIWPIAGGAEDDDSTDAGEDDDAEQMLADAVNDQSGDEDEQDDDKPLGPKGEKALQAEKERRRQETMRRRTAESKATDLQAQLDELRKAGAKDGDGEDGEKPDLDAIRKQVEAELKTEAARERVLDKIEVKAAKAFADPADAVAMLMRAHDPSDFLDDGKPDVEAIHEALEELLEKKPYLGAAQGGKQKFQGKADAGAKPAKPARPQSLNEAVKRVLTK